MSTREDRWQQIDASVARVMPAADGAVFRTLTSADWCREIQRARATPNAISERIRARILNVGAITSTPVDGAGTTKEEENHDRIQ